MKVHLVRTDEYQKEDFKQVGDFLRSCSGPMQFINSDFEFDQGKFPFLKKYYPDFKFKYESDYKKIKIKQELGYPLSWRELFSLCEEFRQVNNIIETDFVVLLTQRRNALNWFSHVQNKDVFVHTGDWNYFLDKDPTYPIAYQVIENVLQSLMNIDVLSVEHHPNIHTKTRGCINDLCLNKKEALFKLRTADICDVCMKTIFEVGINSNVIVQIQNIMEVVRKELLYRVNADQIVKPHKIKISKLYQITIPDLNNLEINFTPLIKTLYVFYLKHPEGVRRIDIRDHHQELLQIYGQLANLDDNKSIATNINNLTDLSSDSFSEKKAKINRAIKDLLGQDLANHYSISGGKGEPLKIGLDPTLVEFD